MLASTAALQLALGDGAWWSVAIPAALSLLAGAGAMLSERARRDVARTCGAELALEREQVRSLVERDGLKDEFLAAVNHELRTPLTSILGFAITLLDRHDLPGEQREQMLRTLVEEAEHLEEILSNMLDLDRLSHGKEVLRPQLVDAGEIVRRTAAQLERRTQRAVQVAVPGPIPVRVDPAKVERIVQNLLANAAKYTPAGSPIIVAAWSEDGGMMLNVEDSGPGIPEDERAAVFEPFRRGRDAQRAATGTGLGLSIVDRFCQLHGGRAWVEEAPTGGCSFRVHLPSVPDPAGLASAAVSGAPELLEGRLHECTDRAARPLHAM